jgi:ketosteroid isomerase-like protein
MTSNANDVLDRHLDSFLRRDLSAILSDYADDALLFTPGETLRGPAQIRRLFEAMLSEFAQPDASFRIHKRSVDGDYAFIVWSAQTAQHIYELGTDTFHVRDGKIRVQSFASVMRPRTDA